MKTFKQLREDWYKSSKSSWNHKEVKIYKNPTFKELANAQYDGRNGFRGYILSNGSLYVWGTEFHENIRKNLKGYNKKAIPIIGNFRGKSKLEIFISNDVLYSGAFYYTGDSLPEMTEIIKNNKYLKRLFSTIDVERVFGS